MGATKEELKTADKPLVVDGLCVPAWFSADRLRLARQYQAHPGDVFVLTYPKCGTTWMETIIYGVRNKGQSFVEDIDHYITSTPFLDRLSAVNMPPQTSSIKTHFSFDLIPPCADAKYICVIRNPKDACVSFYQYLHGNPASGYSNMKFSDFFEAYLQGQTPYGCYFDNIRALWKHKDDANVLIISFEHMKTDLRDIIQRIATFLNVDDLNDEIINRIMTHSSFNYMKQHFDKARNGYFDKHPENLQSQGHPFYMLRTGEGNRGKGSMSEEQSQRLDALFREKTRDLAGMEDFLPIAN